MMIQFTSRSGASLHAFGEPRTTQTRPVPARVRLTRSVVVVIAILALAFFLGMAGHALRRPEPSVGAIARAQAPAQPHKVATADARIHRAEVPHRRRS